MRGKSSALRAKEEFLALYHDGAFEAGTKIPSESSMAEMLGVSRETWRKALGLLRGEGVLYSRHGSGTYLQEPSHRITNDLSQLKSLSKMIAEAGLREQGSCMTCTVGTAPEEVCRFFEAPETAEFVIIQHIRRTEEDVIAVSLGYLPEKYAEKMHGAIPQSLFAFLEESEGIYISRPSCLSRQRMTRCVKCSACARVRVRSASDSVITTRAATRRCIRSIICAATCFISRS